MNFPASNHYFPCHINNRYSTLIVILLFSLGRIDKRSSRRKESQRRQGGERERLKTMGLKRVTGRKPHR
jgi:hypothetical protein